MTTITAPSADRRSPGGFRTTAQPASTAAPHVHRFEVPAPERDEIGVPRMTTEQRTDFLRLRGTIDRVETIKWSEPSGGDLKITIVTKRPDLRDAIASLRAEVEPKPAADGASKRDKTNAQRKLDAYERLQGFADELEAWLDERVEYSSNAAGGRLQQYIMTVALGVAALEGEDVTVALAPNTEAVWPMFPGMSALSEVIDASAAELPEGAASE